MKKCFLLLATGFTMATAIAQENTSTTLLSGQQKNVPGLYLQPDAPRGAFSHYKQWKLDPSRPAAKTTSSTVGSWFDFNIAHDNGTFTDITSTGGNYGTQAIFQDSTIYVPLGTPSPFYWYCHGQGISFDPTSKWYYSRWANITVPSPDFIVASTDDYYVDSVFVLGRFFQRTAGACDTLHIDVAWAGTGGAANAWTLSSTSTSYTTSTPYPITGTGNTTYRYANAHYADSTGLASDVAPVARIVYQMCAAESIDTDANGWNNHTAFAIPVAGGLHVAAGGKVVAMLTLHQSHFYPNGTNINSANEWAQSSWYFTGAEGGLQDNNDFSTGLVIGTSERYNVVSTPEPGGAETYMSKVVASPSYFWNGGQILNPQFEFFIRSPHSKNVNRPVSFKTVDVYPNPANNNLNIAFDVNQSASVTVTLTNMLGQVAATQKFDNATNGVATINTADLVSGMYIYSIRANGVLSTGHVLIAH